MIFRRRAMGGDIDVPHDVMGAGEPVLTPAIPITHAPSTVPARKIPDNGCWAPARTRRACKLAAFANGADFAFFSRFAQDMLQPGAHRYRK